VGEKVRLLEDHAVNGQPVVLLRSCENTRQLGRNLGLILGSDDVGHRGPPASSAGGKQSLRKAVHERGMNQSRGRQRGFTPVAEGAEGVGSPTDEVGADRSDESVAIVARDEPWRAGRRTAGDNIDAVAVNDPTIAQIERDE
jgi:hypothetical protein